MIRPTSRSAEPSKPRRRSSDGPPAHFGDYYLLRPLAGSRSVYLAEDTLLDRVVAVKFIPASDLGSLEQFLLEARTTARIQHPNVAALYCAGHTADWAYLVSEYVRGRPLSEVDKPLPWRRALEIACDLSRALAAVHRRGVLHCDVKPANAVVSEDGPIKLVDFGLAKWISLPPGASLHPERPLVGTPHYIPPEGWRGEELTVRSDLYALAAIVYELCSGRTAFADVPPHLVGHVVIERDAPPLASVAAAVDERFAALLDRCLDRDPARRPGGPEDLLDELQRIRPPARSRVPDGNPYRGLLPFQPEHRAVFFGRNRECLAIQERLRCEPLLVVAGDSGVGKSSVCLAGVIAAVEDAGLGSGSRTWRAVRLVPGRRGLAALAEALAPLDPEQAEQRLRAEPGAFARELHKRLGNGGLLVVVDQLEELVTMATQEAASFAAALAELAAGFAGIRILATVRSDFLGQVSELPALGPLVARAIYLLRKLTADELRQAIVGPAALKGVRFESPALVTELITATLAAHGGLPLLQFTLAEVWEQRDQRLGVIPAGAIERIGGVAGALARHADEVIAHLVPDQKDAARRMLLRLTTRDRTRASRTREELAAGDAAAEAALEALVRGRLVVARDGGVIELAHEALLSEWGTLSRWIDDQSTEIALCERVATAASEWEQCGRAPEALWGQRRLGETAALDPAMLSPSAKEFLATSRGAVRRAAWRIRGTVALAALALLATVLVVRGARERDLEARVAGSLAAARTALAAAQQAEAKLASARAAAFREFDDAHRAAGEEAWHRAVQLEGAADLAFAEAGERYEHALSLGSRREDVRRAFADFLLTRALHERRPAARDEIIRRLRVYDSTGARWRAFHADALLWLSTEPPGATIRIAAVTTDDAGRRAGGNVERTEVAPLERIPLSPGTYQLAISAPGRVAIELPLQLSPGEERRVSLALPLAGEVPEGYVPVPAGRSWFGTSSDESVRQFFNTAPIHPVETGAFLIARSETTYADWIEYLRSLPPRERGLRLPHVGSAGLSGQLDLREERGRWRLALQIGSSVHVMGEGDRLRLPRQAHADQDWLRLPVAGVSFEDARAYAGWLAATGRVPGARLCTEREWERAARGADDREFPSGDALRPEDANFDETYGKRAQSFGPDEVGSHPASRSPFGVDDLAGNVWEWVESSLAPGEAVARGGSAYAAANTCRSVNREIPEPSFRAAVLGIRICADWPKSSAR